MKGPALLAWSLVACGLLFAAAFLTSSTIRTGGCWVQGAGEKGANGLYVGVGYDSMRRPAKATGGTPEPVPNIFASWTKLPSWSRFALVYRADAQAWGLAQLPDTLLYGSTAAPAASSRRPPAEGWASVDGQEPAPTLSAIRSLPAPPSRAWQKVGPQVRMALEVTPATTFLSLLMVGLAFYIWNYRVGGEGVAFSYTAVMDDRQYWRIVTSSLAHLDIFHIVFNVSCLYSLQSMEARAGSAAYLVASINLVILTMLVNMALYRLWARLRSRPEVLHGRAVGYSCVLFAWITAECIVADKYCPLGGIAPGLCFKTWSVQPSPSGTLSFNLAPLFLVLITKLIIPRSSFLGHLSGILCGYAYFSWDQVPLAGLLSLSMHPLLVVAALTALMFANEGFLRLFTCGRGQGPHPQQREASTTLPSSSSSSSSSSAAAAASSKPPGWWLLAALALTQLVLAVIAGATGAHTAATAVFYLLPPMFLSVALLQGPSPAAFARPVFLALPLYAVALLVSLADAAAALGKGPLYLFTGVVASTPLRQGQLFFLLQASLTAAVLLVALRVLAADARDGQPLLRSACIELPQQPAGRSALCALAPKPRPFTGAGRRVGGRDAVLAMESLGHSSSSSRPEVEKKALLQQESGRNSSSSRSSSSGNAEEEGVGPGQPVLVL